MEMANLFLQFIFNKKILATQKACWSFQNSLQSSKEEKKIRCITGTLCFPLYHKRELSRLFGKVHFSTRDHSTKFTCYLSWLLEPEGIASSDMSLHDPMVSTDLPSRDLYVCAFYDFFDIPVL